LVALVRRQARRPLLLPPVDSVASVASVQNQLQVRPESPSALSLSFPASRLLLLLLLLLPLARFLAAAAAAWLRPIVCVCVPDRTHRWLFV
jgi:hypothetical protein